MLLYGKDNYTNLKFWHFFLFSLFFSPSVDSTANTCQQFVYVIFRIARIARLAGPDRLLGKFSSGGRVLQAIRIYSTVYLQYVLSIHDNDTARNIKHRQVHKSSYSFARQTPATMLKTRQNKALEEAFNESLHCIRTATLPKRSKIKPLLCKLYYKYSTCIYFWRRWHRHLHSHWQRVSRRPAARRSAARTAPAARRALRSAAGTMSSSG